MNPSNHDIAWLLISFMVVFHAYRSFRGPRPWCSRSIVVAFIAGRACFWLAGPGQMVLLAIGVLFTALAGTIIVYDAVAFMKTGH